jgi:hypothetical protein
VSLTLKFAYNALSTLQNSAGSPYFSRTADSASLGTVSKHLLELDQYKTHKADMPYSHIYLLESHVYGGNSIKGAPLRAKAVLIFTTVRRHNGLKADIEDDRYELGGTI